MGSFYKIHPIIIMLLHTCGNGKNIRVEYNILRCKTHLFGKYCISTLADFNLSFFGIGLPFFIKSHNNHCGTISLTNKSLVNKFLFPFLHGNGVHNTFSLHTFQSRFNNLKFGRINHHRNLCNIRFRLQEV